MMGRLSARSSFAAFLNQEYSYRSDLTGVVHPHGNNLGINDIISRKRPLLKSDTAIHGAGAGATHKLFKLINYLINYCFQSPQETLVIVFSGGVAHILKNTYYEVKMRRLN